MAEAGIRPDDIITVQVRPLRGDHIHYAFATYVHGQLVDILWDADWMGAAFASEGERYPLDFSNLTEGMYDYHITQSKPHFGVHSGQAHWFGDGLIHVHPGTSWGWFRETEVL